MVIWKSSWASWSTKDTPNVNVGCALYFTISVTDNFFFTEKTHASAVYLDMIENFIFPLIKEFQIHIPLQQVGEQPHWGTIVRSFFKLSFYKINLAKWSHSFDIRITWYNTTRLFSLGICKGNSLRGKSAEHSWPKIQVYKPNSRCGCRNVCRYLA